MIIISRSYKRTPWCGDHKGKQKKRIANQTVRAWLKQHPEAILKGGDYKKLYETWDICDYGSVWTWEQELAWEWERYYEWKAQYSRRSIEEPNEKELYRKWYKYHKAK